MAAGPPQVVIFEATHSETAALTPSTTADDYTFDIVAVLASGDRASLLPEGMRHGHLQRHRHGPALRAAHAGELQRRQPVVAR